MPRATTSIDEAVNDPDVDTVVIGLPNDMHEEAIAAVAAAGKAVLCTKPLARTAEEAKRILDLVESAGVFAGYLEDLVYTPEDAEGGGLGAAAGRSATCCGCAAGRPTPVRTAPGSGTPTRPAAGASSTSAATASRSSAATSARATVPSR